MFLGLLAAAMGLLIVLASLGVVFPGAKVAGNERWIGVVAGGIFLLAGIVVVIQTWFATPTTPEGELPPGTPLWIRATIYGFILIIVAALAGIATWVAFGPGTREFSGFTSFLPRWLDEAAGRAVFGTGAILTWVILLVMAVAGLKRLRSQK